MTASPTPIGRHQDQFYTIPELERLKDSITVADRLSIPPDTDDESTMYRAMFSAAVTGGLADGPVDDDTAYMAFLRRVRMFDLAAVLATDDTADPT